MVVDHPLHEPNVGLHVLGALDVLQLFGRQRPRPLAWGPRLDDARRRLACRLGLSGAAATPGEGEGEQKAQGCIPPDAAHGEILDSV